MSQSRQLAAIMFTDIVGYTALMQRDEQNALKLINRFKEVMESISKAHEGKIVQYFGDGCLLAFDSSSNSVACAIALQKAFREETPVPVRIGLHLGDVIFKNENVFGDGVNIASRIESLGIPGAVLLSKSIRDQVKNQADFQLTSLGSFHFKNVDEPVEVFAVSNEGFTIPKREEMEGKLKIRDTGKRNIIISVSVFILLIASYFIYINIVAKDESEEISSKSIAVLPFVNMSDDNEQEYFSDGMMEEILNQLSKISELKVSSRTSSMLYRNSKKSLKEIAQSLRVANILEGSVRKSNDEIRITVQLIDAASDKHLWSETFDRKINDIFSVQTDIATQIATTLKATLSPEEKLQIEKKQTENTEAYQLYLQGRYHWNKRLDGSLMKGIDYFNKAIEKDSSYALAYAGLGDSYLMLGVYGILQPRKSFPVAKKYIEKALQSDSTLSEAYATLVDINIHYDWDAALAEANFQKAIAFNPGYASAYHWHSEVLIMRKQFEKAFGESLAALKIDPFSLIINSQLGTNYVYAGEMEKAKTQFLKTLELDSSFAIAHHHLGVVYAEMKKFDSALFHIHKSLAFSHDNLRFMATLAYVEGIRGKKEKALRIEKEFLAKAKKMYIPAYDLAVVELGLGKNELALQYLEQAFIERSPWMPFISMIPTFNSLKEETRFKALVRKIEFSN